MQCICFRLNDANLNNLYLTGVGYGQALATWCVVTYYVSLMALTVFYFFASFLPVLPWATCPADYNDKCFDSTSNASVIDFSKAKPAAEIYYE